MLTNNKKNMRYKLLPQMKAYDKLTHTWLPYIMYFHQPNFKSKVINVDNFGLRFNNENDFKKHKFEKNTIFKNNKKKSHIVIGGSTAFGVGASKDENTITGKLSKQSNFNYYNLGGRAFSGFQEIILFQSLINKIKALDEVTIISGANDLYLMTQSNNFNKILGPLFFNDSLNKLNNPYSIRNYISSLINSKKIKNEIKTIISEDEKKIILIDIIKRNIYLWSLLSKSMNIKVTFMLQPVANWINREIINEEAVIFSELDNSKNSINFNNIFSLENYEFYTKELKICCNNYDINFVDTNKLETITNSKKWIFIDRVHLTDDGNEIIKNKIIGM